MPQYACIFNEDHVIFECRKMKAVHHGTAEDELTFPA